MKKTALLAIVCVLGGCSYFDTEPETTGDEIDLTAQQAQPEVRVNVGDAIYQNSNGSVQIFNLDDDAGSDVNYQIQTQSPSSSGEPRFFSGALAPASAGVASAEDPSVEIYPFDDVVYANNDTRPLRKPVYEQAGQDTVIIYFGHDSVMLNGRSKDKIADVAKRFEDGFQGPITVEGHASVRANYPDETTRQAVNLRISMNRAFNVAQALMAKGVPAESIKLIARGDTVPPTGLNGNTQEEAARRVEIRR